MKRRETQVKEPDAGKRGATQHKTTPQKRAEAQARAEARAKRGDKGQLAMLDKLGLTAKRERERLNARIKANPSII